MLDDLQERLRQRWSELAERLSPAQKVAAVTVLLAVVAGLATIILWSTSPDYRVVFDDLDSEAMGEVLERLKELKVPYKLSRQGRAVSVPADMADEMRVVLGGVVGAAPPEDEQSDSWVGKTPDEIRALRLRRLERSLARTIARLDPIASAQVHITPARPSVFASREIPPSASITVTPRRRRLDVATGEVVASLVAGAVTGLEPERVTVVDTRGRRLWPDGEGGAGGLRKLARDREQELSAYLTRELEKVVGPGKASVHVYVELDPTESTTEVHRVLSDGVPKREVVQQEQRTGGIGQIGGKAGASNLNPPGMTPAGQGAGSSTTKRITTDFELSRENKTTVRSRGGIKYLSISARVSGSYEAGKDGGEPVYVPVSKEKMEQLRKLLSVYVRPERGDRLELVDLPLAPETGVGAEVSAMDRYRPYLRFAPYLVALILGLLIVLFGLRPLATFATGGTTVQAEVDETLAALPEGKGADEVDLLEDAPFDAVLSFVQDMAREDPDRTALVLEQWLKKAV